MIRYICDKDSENILEFHGTVEALAADALGLLVLVYSRLYAKSPDDAALFAKAIIGVINDNDNGAFSSAMLEAARESFEEVPHE